MVLAWLLGAAVGPAAVALPVNWTADALASAAQSWFRRLRRTDDLSRLVRAATGTSVDLTRAEFDAVRRLLEDQETWSLAGRGTVDDLATRIASCMPPRDDRKAEDSHAAALTIARGLLEFAVRDLDPKFFQQVLLTRLQRMETDQASALDEAMFDLHADLVAGFTAVMGHLERVLDRLPPGPAHRLEIALYLRTLIDWLNSDPWPRDRQFEPQDRQFEQPVLTPAAIERRLRVTSAGEAGERDLDADDLALQCGRLVVLGGPGSGKTWLAKRIARRCAENALEALAAGGILDEIELPLYTTCARLFRADGDIREAAVSSALDQLADLGGSRISAALGVFLTERNAPTVLVIDSLDEAHGSDERLRQVDTLPWRIVLTSRPSSWNNQLGIKADNDSHRIGELQPLSYPGDVEAFIARWFDQRPEWGNDLAAEIADRPGLQQAATVPLILAFYCIVGGGNPLPDFRRDLYTSVLKRMLTGRWRGSRVNNNSHPDVDTCLQTLRAWAWSGAASHSVSGVGTWADDIPIERSRLGEANEDALDHIATPLGPADVDTGKTLRRFIHRSIREHLVAEHVASLPVDQAVEVLLPHIWYDPDWEFLAPAALAMHPRHDQLLRDLICRAASSDQVPGDLSVIDAGWESRVLLARIASESSEAVWSPEVAGMIGQARLELGRSPHIDDLGGAASWGTSNRQARAALLELLAGQTDAWEAAQLAGRVVQLDPTAEDEGQARAVLLGLLAGQTDGWATRWLAGGVVQLAPTAEDKRQARAALLGLLASQTNGSAAAQLADGVVQLDPTAEDEGQARAALLGLLAGQTNGSAAAQLADGVVQLDPTAEDKRQARAVLLGLLADQTDPQTAEWLAGSVVQLDPTAEDKGQARAALLRLLAFQTDTRAAAQLLGGVVQLAPTAEDKRQARAALLGLLAGQTDRAVAAQLLGGVVQLAPTAEDKRQARAALLGLLVGQTNGWTAAQLLGGVVQLAPTAEDKRQAREALLGLLAGQTDRAVAAQLAGGVVQLAPTAEDKGQARAALLGLLAGQTDRAVAAQLAGGVVQLDPTAEDKRQARAALLGLLASQTNSTGAAQLAGGVVQLDPTAEDKRQARAALLGLLASQTNGWVAEALAGRVVQLDPTAEDKRQARAALLGLLAGQTEAWEAAQLAGRVVQLDPTAEDKRQARAALLGLLAGQTNGTGAAQLLGGVVQLAPTAEDKRQARAALLGLLAGQTNGTGAAQLAGGVVQLDPTAEDKRQARAALLGLLAGQTDDTGAAQLLDGVVQLAPTAEDKRQARAALLGLLASQTNGTGAAQLLGRVVQLAPTAEDKRQAREALLGLLAGQTNGTGAAQLAGGVVQLAPTAEDKRQAREALLGLLAGQTDAWEATQLVGRVVQLAPTVRDLSTWRAWAVVPTVELLAAARQNSTLADWLAALPSLTGLSG